jgi:hypothetical protein
MENKELVKEKTFALIEMTAKFCNKKLNDEYRELTEKMIKKLSKKRNVPFLSGRIEIWAAAIIYSLGQINFLFDKKSQPFSTADEISGFFGQSKSSVSQKAKVIRDLLKLNYSDNEFSLKSIQESNPFNEMVSIDGFIVPISSLPPDMQEYVKEQLKKR